MDKTLLEQIMFQLPGLLALSLDGLRLDFDEANIYGRYGLEKLRVRDIGLTNCTSLTKFLASFSELTLLDYSANGNLLCKHSGLSAQAPNPVAACLPDAALPRIISLRVADTETFRKSVLLVMTPAVSSRALTSLEVVCATEGALTDLHEWLESELLDSHLQSLALDLSSTKLLSPALHGTQLTPQTRIPVIADENAASKISYTASRSATSPTFAPSVFPSPSVFVYL